MELVLDSIELTKNEIDNLVMRNSLYESKKFEMNIIGSEAAAYIETLKAKYKIEGTWGLNGNFLVKISEATSATISQADEKPD